MSGEAEWQTRKKRIDTRLKQKGWKLLPFSPGLNLKNLDRCAIARDDCRRTEEFLQANGLSRLQRAASAELAVRRFDE